MVAHLESRVLLEDSAHAYLHWTEWNWYNVRLLGRPKLEPLYKVILVHAEMT